MEPVTLTLLSDSIKYSHAADPNSARSRLYSDIMSPLWSHLPAARVNVCEDSDHEFTQGLRLKGGGDDDVAALLEGAPHEHCASVDVGGRCHARLGQDVMHAIAPVFFHLWKEELIQGFTECSSSL